MGLKNLETSLLGHSFASSLESLSFILLIMLFPPDLKPCTHHTLRGDFTEQMHNTKNMKSPESFK